ncbi:hypothetical protein OF83DRAFT_588998 [Amylostereum chailletii]|nr:hypothetical protein OF83DRAFT_588998 [Amylostereum chailletii]
MGWSPGNLFHELLRSLNRIQDLPFFTVFLLDAVKLRVYPPIRGYSMNPFPPIVETGFDEFASRVDVRDRTWTLSSIASTHHIAHLGRSL